MHGSLVVVMVGVVPTARTVPAVPLLLLQYNDMCWKTAPDNALDTVFPKVRGLA